MDTTSKVKENRHKSCSSQYDTQSATCRIMHTKSPNVLIYSDNTAIRDNLEATLKKILDPNMYTLYSVSSETLERGAWRGLSALIVVVGSVGHIESLLLDHILSGGLLFAICSDLIYSVLPCYKTVRKNEVVHFNFDKWKEVRMKHDIFDYQTSPNIEGNVTEREYKYISLRGHELNIRVLASEEIWCSPSIIQVTDRINSGIAIFSQIHLETNPCDYLNEEGINSNNDRLGIIHKLLGEIFGLHVKGPQKIAQIDYTDGYFIGNNDDKLSLVEKWCSPEDGQRVHKFSDITLQWRLHGETSREPPSNNFLPVYVYKSPENFSTTEYFDNLSSKSLGRFFIYADVMKSTMHVTAAPLAHGVGAIAGRQTSGCGRGSNSWISPPGQAAISLQVWQKISPTLPLVQHAAALAAVLAIRLLPTYEHLDIRIKWPNDIYHGREIKIGGTVTTANCMGDEVFLNIGTGMNISNSVPTTCVNDIIAEYNNRYETDLAPISIEKFLARYCSQLERILDSVIMDDGISTFRKEYYKYWLHHGEEVNVQTKYDPNSVKGTITGINEAGWLLVQTLKGEISVEPDGNTFDMMSGLVASKA